MRHLQRWTWLIGALLLVAACSKDKPVDQPAKLTPLDATLRVERIWTASVDDKKAVVLRLDLGLSTASGRVYAAGHKGDVIAIDPKSGKVLWRVQTKAPLSGGTAASEDFLVVGTNDGRVFAFDPATGQTRWQMRLNGEVLAPPAISSKLIAVRTGDGKLHALSPADGHELWVTEQQVPRLSLRGTSSPVIVGDVVLCGFDNGKVLAVNGGDGSVQWEATVTPAHGKTELERLSDIDSPVRVAGQDVYAVGFQGRVAMLALDTGQVWWSHEMSSYRGLIHDEEALYLASADGDVVALKARTGAEVWRQNALRHRGLSAVAVMDDAVVTGDYQGYLHWLDRATGALAGRASTGKYRISTQPLVFGDTVVAINDRGQISAWRVTPQAASGGKKKTAAAPATPAASQPAPATTPAVPAAPAAPAPATEAAPAGATAPTPEASPTPQPQEGH